MHGAHRWITDECHVTISDYTGPIGFKALELSGSRGSQLCDHLAPKDTAVGEQAPFAGSSLCCHFLGNKFQC